MIEVRFRRAQRADLKDIVALLADDELGKDRESTGPEAAERYEAAFESIVHSGGEIIVGESGGQIVAAAQLTFIPALSYQGRVRAQVEDVRVASDLRGQGIGSKLIEYLEERSIAVGCELMQLDSNNVRTRAHDFYKRLGYVPSHVGFKKVLQ